MKEGFRERFMKYVTLAIILTVMIVGGMAAYPNWNRGKSLRLEEAELRRQIAEKKREIAKLTENQNRFRSDREFVESIARQNRRVYPGELVFVFED